MGDFRTEEQVMKTLHIIVRHRANPNPKYANQWLDDDRILSTVTYSEIADLCGYALASEAPVRIHRTGTSTEAPAVCCEAIVKAVRPMGALFEVEFAHARTLHLAPPFLPDGKKSWYFAEVAHEPSGEAAEPAAPPASDGVPIAPATWQPASPGELRPRPSHLEMLEKGIDVWNFARQSKPDVKPELAGADLRQALGNARNRSIQLANADLRCANLAGLELGGAILVGANLEGADLVGASWIGAKQDQSKTYLDIWATMGNLDLRGADLSGADLSGTRSTRPHIQGASFRRAKMVGTDLSGSYLAGICFDEADLRGANLRGCNLTNASFDGCHLCGADLSTATLKPGQIAKAITDGDTKLPADWDF
jgi:uncharacterized protein YjbI with pentapeptide repeats